MSRTHGENALSFGYNTPISSAMKRRAEIPHVGDGGPEECWAVGILLADPWLLERDVHTVGGQVESQPARL